MQVTADVAEWSNAPGLRRLFFLEKRKDAVKEK
jgi:hypothetical protein